MQSSTVVVLLGVCSQLLLPLECRQICSPDAFTVKVNGSSGRCLSCDKCHPGLGLFPVCGSEISPTQNIECKPCPPGKFSNTYDSAPCHECHECVTHEVVSVNCTKLSDRNCSGTCQKGYYFVKKAPHIHSCQQCSHCCFDGKDVIQEECVTQGLNATNQHCSQRGEKKCGPNPMSVTNPEPTNLSWSSSTTDSPTNHKTNTLTVVFGALAGMLLAALAGTILFKQRKGKRETPLQPDIVLHVQTPSGPASHQGNISVAPIQQNQEVSPKYRLQAVQNKAFAQSAEGTPCHSEDEMAPDEIDVSPDVNKRTKRPLKRQPSREAPNDDASQKLLDRPEENSAGEKGSIHGGSAQGAEGGNRRRSSSESMIRLLTTIRRLSRSSKADYQLVQEEVADYSEDSLKTVEEGTSKLVFLCEARGKKKITYQWLKDGSTLQGQRNSNLVLNRVKPSDFGYYCCEVRWSDGQNKSEPVKLLSPVSELDVFPREGMRFKYLTEAFIEDTEIEDTVKILLQKKVPGAGWWQQVARNHQMSDNCIRSLDGSHEAGNGVIEYLKSHDPTLTVYEFCKSLKEMKRNDIVNILSDHLVSVSCHV